jgi:hypothetical protein
MFAACVTEIVVIASRRLFVMRVTVLLYKKFAAKIIITITTIKRSIPVAVAFCEYLNFFELIYQLLFGKDSGPKLTTFLYEASKDSVLELLDII